LSEHAVAERFIGSVSRVCVYIQGSQSGCSSVPDSLQAIQCWEDLHNRKTSHKLQTVCAPAEFMTLNFGSFAIKIKSVHHCNDKSLVLSLSILGIIL